MHTLAQVAEDIQHRVIHLFARDNEGNRACNGGSEMLNKDPHFRDYVPFHGQSFRIPSSSSFEPSSDARSLARSLARAPPPRLLHVVVVAVVVLEHLPRRLVLRPSH